MTSFAFALRAGMLRVGYPRWMVDVYVEAFESELAEIFADMADNVARATGPWLTVTA